MKLLHHGFFLFPFLPVDGIGQIHQRNGLPGPGLLLQLGHGRLFGAVVDNAVDHPIVIFHGHLCGLQVVLRALKRGQLPETEAVTVMIGYPVILLDRNNVADTHGGMAVICGVFVVEPIPKILQSGLRAGKVLQGRGVNQIVVFALHRAANGFQPVQPLIPDVPQLLVLFELVNGEAVAAMGEERGLPRLLPVHSRFQRGTGASDLP